MAHEAVLCDLGGVVVDVESDRLMHQIAQFLGRSFEEVQEAVYHPDLLLPFELGRISPEGYFQGLQARLDLSWSYAQFLQAWNGIFTENRDVTRLLDRLRKSYRLVALTNTNVLHLEHIRANFPSLGVFEHWIASCHVGLRKPDPAMYAHALQHLGVEASAVIYVDDRPEMVEAGRQAGLTAIRCEHGRQLAQALQEAGVHL